MSMCRTVIGKCRNSQITPRNTSPLHKMQKLNTGSIVLSSQEDKGSGSIISNICSPETSQSQLYNLLDGMKSSDLGFSEILCVLSGEVNI